jgi:hypothetical protein
VIFIVNGVIEKLKIIHSVQALNHLLNKAMGQMVESNWLNK